MLAWIPLIALLALGQTTLLAKEATSPTTKSTKPAKAAKKADKKATKKVAKKPDKKPSGAKKAQKSIKKSDKKVDKRADKKQAQRQDKSRAQKKQTNKKSDKKVDKKPKSQPKQPKKADKKPSETKKTQKPVKKTDKKPRNTTLYKNALIPLETEPKRPPRAKKAEQDLPPPLLKGQGSESFITKSEYGKLLYKHPRNIGCIKCHGRYGKRRVLVGYIWRDKKRTIVVPEIYSLDFDSFKAALSRDRGIMPRYFLDESEIEAIWAYLQSIRK